MKQYLVILFFFLFSKFAFAQEQFAVFFDSNKFDCTKLETKKLQDWIAANKNVKIVAIHGFTDEDGSNGFNDTLAKKRVNFIYNQVKDKIKIREDFKTISFGENFQQKNDKAKNRKATIFYLLEKDLPRENEILGITKSETKPKVIADEDIVPIEEESMSFPEEATLQDKIELATRGTLIRLNDINFYINTFAIIPNSKAIIADLVRILDKYPKLRIEIQGHICCVNKDIKNLSLDRAKQVKRVLVYEGIADRRIKVKGFGVSKPKFAIPEKSEYEASQNRRVEIMILDK